MKDRTQMTRTCSACGLEKPLAAFLEISSTHGTRYGNLCATCRGAGITEKKNKVEEEQSTVATSGSRIGLKERVFIEKEQKKQIISDNEERTEQLNERDRLQEEKKEKTTLKERLEKNHRNTYLDTKTQPSFLSKTLPSSGTTNIPPAHTSQRDPHIEREKITINEKQQIKDAHREEQKKTADLQHQYHDPKGELWGYTPSFLGFQDRIGVVSAFNVSKVIKENLKKLSLTKDAPQQTNATKKDPILDFAEKTWGPTTPRRNR